MSEREFRALVDNLPDIIIRFDRAHRFIFASPAIIEATDGLIHPQMVLGRRTGEIGLPDDLVRQIDESLERVFATGMSDTIEFVYSAPSGPRHFQGIAAPEQFIVGRIETVITISRDITGLRMLMAELSRARLETERKAAQLRLTQEELQRSHAELEERIKERTAQLEAEVAERRHSEGRLRESEELYRLLFESVSDAIFMIRQSDGQILMANESATRMYGYSREELLRLKNTDVSAEPDATRQATRNVRSRIPVRYHRKKDGTVFPVEITASLFHLRGEPGHIAAIRDISERMLSEKILSESEQRYRAIVEDQTEHITRFTPDGIITFVNGAVCRFHGASSEQLLGRNLFAILPPSDAEKLKRLMATATPEQPVATHIHPIHGANVQESWQQWKSRALFDESGRVIEYQGVGWDITEQKLTEEALARREQEFRALAENAPDPIVRYNRDIVRIYANAALARALETPRPELIGKDLSSTPIPETMRQDYVQAVRSVFDTGQESIFVLQLDPGKGSLHIQYRLTPEYATDGQVESVLAIGRDITPLMRLEQELRKAKEAAETASRAKSMFLAHMSHEIRTPLSSIMSVIELALMPGGQEQASTYLEMARQPAAHLLGLINNLLDLSRIESGKLALERKEFDLPRMLDSIALPLAVTAGAKGLGLAQAIDPAVPPGLKGDELRLRQILLNLVGNAIKYTEAGGITVSVRLDGQSAMRGDVARLLFTVRDTGMGIPPGKHETIFEGFSQVGAASYAPSSGSGLGLDICRQLVEAMGGRIWVESAVGQGSAFHFTLELGIATGRQGPCEQAPASSTAQAARPFRILLVEDNLVNQMLTAEILSRLGHDVATASDGHEALDALRGSNYDVVLMDVQMPGMDGMETTRRIREGLAGDPAVPVVAMTAYALDGDRERFLQAGMDEHIPKPFMVAELEKVLAGICARDSG